MLKSIAAIQTAVKEATKKSRKVEVEKIIADGFEDFSNAMLALNDVDMASMLTAKEGGNMYAQPMALYARIDKAAKEMAKIQETKKSDWLRYAQLTGHDLNSKVNHDADATIKVRKAQVDGKYVTPIIKAAQDRRNSLRASYDLGKAQIAGIVASLSDLVAKERIKIEKMVSKAEAELADVYSEIKLVEEQIVGLFDEAKALEFEYAIRVDEKGKRLYNKDSEINKWYSSVLRDGRTAITEFKKYIGMYGIDSVIPMGDVERATKVFGL